MGRIRGFCSWADGRGALGPVTQSPLFCEAFTFRARQNPGRRSERVTIAIHRGSPRLQGGEVRFLGSSYGSKMGLLRSAEERGAADNLCSGLPIKWYANSTVPLLNALTMRHRIAPPGLLRSSPSFFTCSFQLFLSAGSLKGPVATHTRGQISNRTGEQKQVIKLISNRHSNRTGSQTADLK